MTEIKSIGVSATREALSESQQHAFFDLLMQYYRTGATEVHHGACTGGDAFIHMQASRLLLTTHVHPPTIKTHSAEAFLLRHPRRVDHEAKPYGERNDDIVEAADVVIIAPRYPEKHEHSKRSGTWQTARKAKAAGKLVRVADYDTGEQWTYFDPANAAVDAR
jgi:hypothetical protein